MSELFEFGDKWVVHRKRITREQPVLCREETCPRVVFFFRAEDGIRDRDVTGVQTCALPISLLRRGGLGRPLPPGGAGLLRLSTSRNKPAPPGGSGRPNPPRRSKASAQGYLGGRAGRSEERRVGKEGRAG